MANISTWVLPVLAAAVAAAQTTSYVHDEIGRLIRVSYPNGKTVAYS